MVHPKAALGFDVAASAYERSRPDYPPAAVDLIVVECAVVPGARVVDLGAGTGKLTRPLIAAGADVVAVEPVAGMRQAFATALPGVAVMGATAEALALRDGSCDAVVAGQAFHWFANDDAVAEIHRVLRPRGALALVWNHREWNAGWTAELTSIFESWEAAVPRERTGAWREALDNSPLFTPLATRHFDHRQVLAPEQVVERVASMSWIASLPDGDRDDALGAVRDLVTRHPECAGRAELLLPYRTEVHWAMRVT